MANVIEGRLVVAPGARFVLVSTRFNAFIVEHLVAGARDAILRHGGTEAQITEVRVPGAWELPVALAHVAEKLRPSAIVALGAVIRGSTPHFDYVAGEAAKGAASVQISSGIPVAFGVLTTDTIEQAVERAGTKAGNKGYDAAMAAIEMIDVLSAIGASGVAPTPAGSSAARGRPARRKP
jgi:6,7-dimethyl-8-ribityllumazine synthase